MRKRGYALAFSALFQTFCLAQSKCYFPDGSDSPEDVPCDPSAKYSACCRGVAGSYCMDTKFCREPNGKLSRGSCSDQNWLDPGCAKQCLGRFFVLLMLRLPISNTVLLRSQEASVEGFLSEPAPTRPTHSIAATMLKAVVIPEEVDSKFSPRIRKRGHHTTYSLNNLSPFSLSASRRQQGKSRVRPR